MICLQKRESIHPGAEHLVRGHLGTPRREIVEMIGKQMRLYGSPEHSDAEFMLAMNLPFLISLPMNKMSDDQVKRILPPSIQLDRRIVETFYELVVTVQHGRNQQQKHYFPIPLRRYDNLSTFGMFNKPKTVEQTVDHIVYLYVTLPKQSYGPTDPFSVSIRLGPNPDLSSKSRRVSVQKLTVTIEEEITYNYDLEDEQQHQKKVKPLVKKQLPIGVKLPDDGWATTMILAYPTKSSISPDSSTFTDGVLPRGKNAFPTSPYGTGMGFTTIATLYRIDYYLVVKAQLSSAKDITIRVPITVTPFSSADCKNEMDAIENVAKTMLNDNSNVLDVMGMNAGNTIIKGGNWNAGVGDVNGNVDGLRSLGVKIGEGGMKKPLIE